MNNSLPTIGAFGVGVALTLALTEVNPAQGAIINKEFKVDIEEGPLTGQTYTGVFSYDDESTPVGFGYGSEEFFLTGFEFDFDEIKYTLNDVTCRYTNVCVPGITPPFWVGEVFPEWGTDSLALTTKSSVGFDFGSSIFLASQSEFNYGNVGSGVGVFRGSVTYTSVTYTTVPEPTSLLGLITLGTFGAASSLKRKLNLSKSIQKETTTIG